MKYILMEISKQSTQYLNVSFNFIEGESLIMGLKDIAVSSVQHVLLQVLSHHMF